MVWAKVTGFPWWPGQVRRVRAGGLKVLFFGTRDYTVVKPMSDAGKPQVLYFGDAMEHAEKKGKQFRTPALFKKFKAGLAEAAEDDAVPRAELLQNRVRVADFGKREAAEHDHNDERAAVARAPPRSSIGDRSLNFAEDAAQPDRLARDGARRAGDARGAGARDGQEVA